MQIDVFSYRPTEISFRNAKIVSPRVKKKNLSMHKERLDRKVLSLLSFINWDPFLCFAACSDRICKCSSI